MSTSVPSNPQVSTLPQPAIQDTANLLKYGWRCVLVGWALPIIPIVGMFLLAIASVLGQTIGIIAIVRGNASGGLKLLLVAMFGSMAVALCWVLVYGGLAVAFR